MMINNKKFVFPIDKIINELRTKYPDEVDEKHIQTANSIRKLIYRQLAIIRHNG